MKVLPLLLLTLPLAAQTPSLGIFLDFAKAPAAAALEEMKREVAARLRASQLELRWRALEENRGTEAFDRLVVVRFRGQCIARPQLPALDESLPFVESALLASTSVNGGRVLPYSVVDCDQIRRSLGEKVFSFGSALGVVVAHELQHILSNSVRHAKSGWMRQALDWKDLTKKAGQENLPRFSFSRQ
jgi:hypothetical protein